MSVIRPYDFPIRLSAANLKQVYASLEEAFAAHDHLYVTRFGAEHPELRGCALLAMGNRVGGERVLDRHNVRTARSCLYRAYAAWVEDDSDEARRWLTQGRAIGGEDGRLSRLASLVERRTFRMVFHWDFHGYNFLAAFQNLPGIEMITTRHLYGDTATALPSGQALASVVPQGAPIDLVLLDDLKMVPVGIGDLGAPVIVVIHDSEWYYDLLDHVSPDIDMLSVGATSEVAEAARPFGTNATTYFFPLHMSLPESGGATESLADVSNRKVDIFYSGSLGHDFYRYKKQSVLALAGIDSRFAIKIEETFFPINEFWQEMRHARFSFMTSRCCNYISTRAVESVVCGTFHLVEEEDGAPFFFSEPFACFPVYRRTHIREDVERHLNNYDNILTTFRQQLPQFEAEFKSVLPYDRPTRALRFLRHALFMTHVEKAVRPRVESKPKRDMVYMNEVERLIHFPPSVAAHFVEQTKPVRGLRHAIAVRNLLLAQKKTAEEALQGFKTALQEGIEETPDSLALHHTLGLCLLMLGQYDEADRSFAKVVAGDLRLAADDPPPMDVGRLNSLFWINDARIRERCPDTALPLVPTKDVWISFAWANRAEVAIKRGAFADAAAFAKKSIELFLYNEDVHRLYLRAAYNLAAAGDAAWGDEFLQSFTAACHSDATILHDFAAPAFHVLMQKDRLLDAVKILEELKLYRHRVKLADHSYTLYDEFVPLMQRYGVPHCKLR